MCKPHLFCKPHVRELYSVVLYVWLVFKNEKDRETGVLAISRVYVTVAVLWESYCVATETLVDCVMCLIKTLAFETELINGLVGAIPTLGIFMKRKRNRGMQYMQTLVSGTACCPSTLIYYKCKNILLVGRCRDGSATNHRNKVPKAVDDGMQP